jgi:phosphoribosylformylglycinamidine cyclo-ligase
MNKSNSYENLGASASKEGLHRALEKSGLEMDARYFCQVLPARDGYHRFMHCDGAGTKSMVSFHQFEETGNAQAFKGLAQDALAMNLDDIFASGPAEELALANTIGRNKKAVPDEALQVIISEYNSLTKKFGDLGIPIQMAGGETADCGDIVRTILVDAIVSGKFNQKSLVDLSRIEAGDVIVGLSSTGQTTYEDSPNSGISSNGLTLARNAILSSKYKNETPYAGKYELSDTPEVLQGQSIFQALTSPTRIYAPILNALHQKLGANIHGIIHLTGGAHTKILRFAKNLTFIKNDLFPVPPIFQLIQETGDIPLREMYEVFNMGHRIEIILPPSFANEVITICNGFKLKAKIIGEVVANTNNITRVIIETAEKLEYRLPN